MNHQFSDKALGVFVGIGVLCGMAFGALVALIMRDRKQTQQGQLSGGVHVWNMLGGQVPPWAQGGPVPPWAQSQNQLQGAPQEFVQTTTPEINAELRPTVTQTLSVSPGRPVRVLNGGSQRHWRAQLRNVGPPGSIAYVSTDPSSLSFPSMSVAIPAGGFTDVRIRPGDALFAIGTVRNVQLSIAASEEIA